MNIHTPDITAIPERDEAEAALNLLRRWATTATATDILELDPSVARLVPGSDGVDYPAFTRDYPSDFAINDGYKETLPDPRGQTANPARWHFELPPALAGADARR
jgi:GTP cyclohydrolase I